jgi:allantoinase
MIPQSEGEWALRGRAVVTPEGVCPAAVIVRGERIAAIVGVDDVGAGVPVTDVGDRMILPGLIDSHVHINEPGRTDWEGFETATKAAAAGGITTLIDMPLNSSPVTTTVAALRAKQEATAGKLWVDVGFHGGVVPGNAEHIQPLIDAGVCAFKAFLCHSGVHEFPNVTEADLRAVIPTIAAAGLPLFVHAELVSPLPPGVEEHFAANPRSYSAYLATRPPEWEVAAIQMMIDLCRETHCHVHIVHLSAAEAAKPLIKKAKAEGMPLTVETCPHYLTFVAEEIQDGEPTFKCAPPIRNIEQQGQLRAMVANGLIDTVGSDHSPAPAELKHAYDGNLQTAWGGIASLQLLLPAAWTALGDLMRPSQFFGLLTSHPANLVGVADRKGAIAPGRDADLVVFNPRAEFEVTAATLRHRHKITPYLGRQLCGIVEKTYVRGRKIYEWSEILGRPDGQTLPRNASAKRP